MSWQDLYAFGAGPGRHGALSIHDGVQFGLSPDQLRAKAIRDCWERPFDGVLFLPGSNDNFWRRHAAVMLALQGSDWSPARIALARFSAAYAVGLLARPKPLVEVTRPHHLRTSELPGVRTFRSRRLGSEHLTHVEGLPCTSAARTIRDFAWDLNVDALRRLAVPGIQRGWLAVEDLVAQQDSLGHGRARRRFDRLVAQLAARPVDSEFEWEVREGLDDRGLAPWPKPFPWRCADGVVINLDIAFPSAWLCIECDGRAKYMLGADFSTDRVRWSEASRCWQIIWLDYERWRSKRKAVLDDIEQRLEQADRSRPPALPAEPV